MSSIFKAFLTKITFLDGKYNYWCYTWPINSFKFSKIPGIYYKRSQYPEKLKLFKDAIQVLENLELKDEPIMETLKENIEFIKKEMEKKRN